MFWIATGFVVLVIIVGALFLNRDTGIFSAIAKGDLDGVSKMISENPAVVNQKKIFGLTPIIKAAQTDNLPIIDLLIKHGADLKVKGLLHNAVETGGKSGNTQIVVRILECGVQVDSVSLIKSAQTNNLPIIDLLIKHGADLKVKGLLHHAAKAGVESDNPQIVLRLLECGVDVNSIDESNGTTALNYIVHECPSSDKGYMKMIETLLNNKADVNLMNTKGIIMEAPLHFIVRFIGQEPLIDLLLAHGADINLINRYGLTPLHYAARSGRLDVCKYLWKKGADPQSKGKIGMTPGQWARKHNVYLGLESGFMD